jgi:hypothetical protein
MQQHLTTRLNKISLRVLRGVSRIFVVSSIDLAQSQLTVNRLFLRLLPCLKSNGLPGRTICFQKDPRPAIPKSLAR